METQYEGTQASPAVQMMCRLFVEKVTKEQQELAQAAGQTEPDKIKDGYILNIERGIWVREVAPSKEEPKQSAPVE